MSPLSGILVKFGREYSPVMYISFTSGYGKPMTFEELVGMEWGANETQTVYKKSAWGVCEPETTTQKEIRFWWDV